MNFAALKDFNMCIKNTYNDILRIDDIGLINDFMDDCSICPKYGSCDYLGWLDRKLVLLEAVDTPITNDI